MTGSEYKQLNPFELKIAIGKLLGKIKSVNDIQGCLADFDMLEAQEDKTLISKLLFKELFAAKPEKIPVICFMLEHYVPKEELINKLWSALKNQNLQSEVKITILNLLRELDSDWSYQTCEDYLEDDAKALLDENTKTLLNTAVINPEVQIDFLDFMATIKTQDKIALLNSLNDDFNSDALANILIPVFVSNPDSPEGLEALKLLGGTKSMLALHVLEEMKDYVTGNLLQTLKKSLSTIKISGMRVDDTKEFYKKVLSDSKPHKFYVTYPDGHGDVAMIFTRITENNKIRFVSIVANLDTGIRDCFGFFEISEFECSKILERFLKDEKTVNVAPETFAAIIHELEQTTIKNNHNTWKFPYEYVCWKNLLIDIDTDEKPIEDVVKGNVALTDVDAGAITKLAEMKISTHWFLDMNYSPEFTQTLEKLKTAESLDTLIDTETKIVFDEVEDNYWIKKLIFAAYLKYSAGKTGDASIIYSIAMSGDIRSELYGEILKRSIYEYLMVIKYDKNIESHNLTIEDINDKIKYIEENWVKNV